MGSVSCLYYPEHTSWKVSTHLGEAGQTSAPVDGQGLMHLLCTKYDFSFRRTWRRLALRWRSCCRRSRLTSRTSAQAWRRRRRTCSFYALLPRKLPGGCRLSAMTRSGCCARLAGVGLSPPLQALLPDISCYRITAAFSPACSQIANVVGSSL